MSDLDRDALEAEREFLLRSLADLESERADGNIDDETYGTLHDDYTARAAAAIRSLDAGADLMPEAAPEGSKAIRWITIGGIIVFALVAAFVLTSTAGQRRPGDTITGRASSPPAASGVSGASGETGADPGPGLAAAAKANPESYAARIAYARYLLQAGELVDAIPEFGAAARLDPSQPEPPTYAGWAGALLAQQVEDAQARRPLLDASLERMSEVTRTHPDYPDAHALKGVTLFRMQGNAKDAIPEFQKFLVLTDDSNPIRDTVLSVLAQAQQAVDGTS
jgi:cytochrome c-type biogenesis protein CcmH/NrfG